MKNLLFLAILTICLLLSACGSMPAAGVAQPTSATHATATATSTRKDAACHMLQDQLAEIRWAVQTKSDALSLAASHENLNDVATLTRELSELGRHINQIKAQLKDCKAQ
jgi:starvation-inducible outer membrane lipoprotein